MKPSKLASQVFWTGSYILRITCAPFGGAPLNLLLPVRCRHSWVPSTGVGDSYRLIDFKTPVPAIRRPVILTPPIQSLLTRHWSMGMRRADRTLLFWDAQKTSGRHFGCVYTIRLCEVTLCLQQHLARWPWTPPASFSRAVCLWNCIR